MHVILGLPLEPLHGAVDAMQLVSPLNHERDESMSRFSGFEVSVTSMAHAWCMHGLKASVENHNIHFFCTALKKQLP